MRRSPIKRGTKHLNVDPEKQRAWQQRSAPLKGGDKDLTRTAMTTKPTRRNREYEAHLDALTPALILRAKGVCEVRWPGICTGNGVHRHHRKMGRGMTSQDSLAALLLVCRACHAHLHAHPKTSKAQGYLVGMTQDPAEVPVMLLRKAT
jgi:hypothetical protein